MINVLTFYIQVLYHRGWFRAVETARSGLNASLLVRHPDTGKLFVNFDPQILELLQEAKYLRKLNLEINDSVLILCRSESRLKATRESYVEMNRFTAALVTYN